MSFQITALNILMLVALAVPGFILVKAKLIKADILPSLSVILLYVCQPCLSLYSFQQATYSREMLVNLGIVFLGSLVFQILVMFICYLFFAKSYDNPKSRVAILACACGNVGFFGIPMLNALMPDHPEAVIYSAVFVVSMNIVGWTVGMFVLSRDKSYISVKKLVLNPTTIILVLALPLFFTKTTLPDLPMRWVEFFANMATPLAMLMLGMRFASADFKELFSGYRQYVAIGIKLVLFPLAVYGVFQLVYLDPVLESAMFILAAMPPAAVTLNFAELTSTEPKTASSIVLVGSLFCVVTLPIIMLLL
jgi:Predicted permeases